MDYRLNFVKTKKRGFFTWFGLVRASLGADLWVGVLGVASFHYRQTVTSTTTSSISAPSTSKSGSKEKIEMVRKLPIKTTPELPDVHCQFQDDSSKKSFLFGVAMFYSIPIIFYLTCFMFVFSRNKKLRDSFYFYNK